MDYVDFLSDEPSTFVLPGHEPDVHLNVFGKEIYAHSLVLKLYSAYFRKFMDAPRQPEQRMSLYSYEYVTVVDEDGTIIFLTCGPSRESAVDDR